MANKDKSKRKKSVEELIPPKAKPANQKPSKEKNDALRQIQKEYYKKLREAEALADGNMSSPPEKDYE